MSITLHDLALPPFELAPDARFFFAAMPHQRAMAYLGYALAKRQGFAVLTGEIGAGKTMLLEHLVQNLAGRREIARATAPRVDALGALRLVAGAFGLDGGGDAGELRARLARHLRRPEVAGALLIIDEAQNLSLDALEEVRVLANHQAGAHPLLQVALVGQPQLKRLLAHPDLDQLRQRVTAAHHLGPLDAADTVRYVTHRLAVAGCGDASRLFDDGALARLHGCTGGVPRCINRLCDRLLLMASLEGRRLTDVDVDRVHAELEEELPSSDLAAARGEAGPVPFIQLSRRPVGRW